MKCERWTSAAQKHFYVGMPKVRIMLLPMPVSQACFPGLLILPGLIFKTALSWKEWELVIGLF